MRESVARKNRLFCHRERSVAILEKTLFLEKMNQRMAASKIGEPETLCEGRKISRKVSKMNHR
jgi:hypothetical protein